MTGVILGLVAVVLLVVAVVTIGVRSMNRRESNLPPERVKALAEGKDKGPKRHRPAEDTFFETFPKDFDAFEEPQRTPLRQRVTKPVSAVRGRRGVDEWGDSDDYDDEYWSRVRADEGGFGGSIAAKKAAPGPAASPAPAAAATPPAREEADPNAATVQAPLPGRSGLAGLVEPSRPVPAAEQKTVTFAAPTPDVLDSPPPAGQSSGSFAAPPSGTPTAFPAAALAPDPLSTGPGPLPPRPAGAGRGGAGSDAGRTGGPAQPRRSPLDTTGPFASPAAADSTLTTGPVRVDPLNTGPVPARPLNTGPAPADPLTSGPVSTGAFASTPGAPAAGGGGALSGVGSDSSWSTSALPPSPAPAWQGAADVLDDPVPSTGSATTWRADDPYKLPAHDIGYPAPGYGPAGPASYEVRTGWAVPEDAAPAAPGAGGPPSGGALYQPRGYDAPAEADILSGYYKEPAGPATPAAWPEQGGSWPAYDEIPGGPQQPSTGTGRRGRRGSHRIPDTDRPDSYR